MKALLDQIGMTLMPDKDRDRKDIEETRFRIAETVEGLGLMDFDLDKDPKRTNRLTEILAQLPDGFIQDLDARLARETKPDHALFEAFVAQHHISKAESLLLASVLAGKSAASHASEMGISVNTARTHVRRLLDKTGARNQTDLVRIFFSKTG